MDMAITSRQLTFQLSGGPPYGIRLQGGETSPFVISKIRPASKAEAIGLQECDVIVAVNGITSRGLSHLALTALMDSVNTTLNILVLRGPGAFGEVDIVQHSLGAQLTTLSQSQISALLANNQSEIITPSRDIGGPSWSDNNGGSSNTFRLQSVHGKQRQNKQNNTNIYNNNSQPTDVVTYSVQPVDKTDNYYSRDEQSYNEDGVMRHTVEETERKTNDGMRMTTVTRREYSTRTTTSNDGPQIAREFFQTSVPGGVQEWFGERTEDGTYQTRSVDQVRGSPLNQQSIANSAWTQHRGTLEQSENTNLHRGFTAEPQVRIYETPGVKQAQSIVLPDFQISIEAGRGARTDTRLIHPIVTVTPAEDHDTVSTLTLVGPPSGPHTRHTQLTQHQQHVKAYQGQALDSANDHRGHYDHHDHHDHHGYTGDYVDSVPVSMYDYYEPTEIQRNRSTQQQQQGDWQQTRSREHQYQSTPVEVAEVTWHEPSSVKIHRQPVESQGYFVQGHLSQDQPNHVDNITVSIGDRSHFTVSKSDREQYHDTSPQQASHQPYPSTSQYHEVTPVEDIYQHVYRTNHFPQDSSNNFDQRSRPAPVTYGQPYQQKPVVNYQPPQPVSPPSVQYPYQPSHSGVNVYQAPPSDEMRYQQHPPSGEYMYQPPQRGYPASRPANDDIYHSPITTVVKTANKLPLNPHFRQEQSTATNNQQTLNGQQEQYMFQQQDRLPYDYDVTRESRDLNQTTQEPMSYNMAIEQARYEGRNQPITADPRYHVIAGDVTPIPTGYMIPQQVVPSVTAAPPPPAPPAPPPPPANPYKVYGIVNGSNDPDKRNLENKVNLANSVAHSVTSPANSNSRGQKMFLRRQQNAHKWTKSGPDPQPEPPSITSAESKTVRAGHLPLARPPPATVPGVQLERWNSVTDSGPSHSGVSLLRRSDTVDQASPSGAVAGVHIPAGGNQSTSNAQHQVPVAVTAIPSQTLSYRPVKFQFQKPAPGSLQQQQQQQQQHWNQAPGVAPSNNIMHAPSSGFTDL